MPLPVLLTMIFWTMLASDSLTMLIPSPRFPRITLLRMTGEPAANILIPYPLFSMTVASISGLAAPPKLTAPLEPPSIKLLRITGDPNEQDMPVPQFTMTLDVIVGEEPETAIPALPLVMVKPEITAWAVSPD